MDYLDWRGDLSFENAPFNNLDNLLLSILSYVDFGDIVNGIGEQGILLWEAAGLLYQWKSEEIDADRSFVSYAPEVFRKMAETKRFANLKLKNYVNKIDEDKELQFSAICIELPDNKIYVSFRGTDDTIVGWKEDFNLCYETVPAQKKAVIYLKKIIETLEPEQQLIVGGHSKGGHLAIYSCAGISKDKQERIHHIYTNDGPGFESTFLKKIGYRRIKDKITRIIPSGSIVGVLFYQDVNPIVVDSDSLGVMQHNPLSWQALGSDFIVSDSNTEISQAFEEAFRTWMNNLPMEERKPYVDDLFDLLYASGETNLSGLQTMGLSGAHAIVKQLEIMSPKTKAINNHLIQLMLNQVLENYNIKLPRIRKNNLIIKKKTLSEMPRRKKAKALPKPETLIDNTDTIATNEEA